MEAPFVKREGFFCQSRDSSVGRELLLLVMSCFCQSRASSMCGKLLLCARLAQDQVQAKAQGGRGGAITIYNTEDVSIEAVWNPQYGLLSHSRWTGYISSTN